MLHAKTQTGEDETSPTKGLRFAVMMYAVTFLFRAQEFHEIWRATARKREDSAFNTDSIEEVEAAETILRPHHKAFSTWYSIWLT